MSDLIDRQAAIDGILHLMPPNPNLDDRSAEQLNFSAWKCALTCAEASIKMMPSAQPQQWIPVTDRLPDEWKRVLIQNDEGLFLVGFVKDRGWGKEWYYQYEMYDYDAYIESEQGKIVAWCELPDRWKG